MTFKKQPPHTKPWIGCMTCGGGEMQGTKDKITANLKTVIYYGSAGGWKITKDDNLIYKGSPDLEFNEYPTLMKFENMARKNPNHDWRAICFILLRGATYQRQGENEWVLIGSNRGLA